MTGMILPQPGVPDASLLRSLTPPAGPNASRQADFASVLGIENRLTPRAGGTPEDEARAVAEGFVAKVFIEPMLALARESNDQPPPFGPGPGEKQFGSLIDAQRSLEMVRSARWGIVERLAGDLTRAAPHAPEPTHRLDASA
jgi:hypothetical protein